MNTVYREQEIVREQKSSGLAETESEKLASLEDF